MLKKAKPYKHALLVFAGIVLLRVLLFFLLKSNLTPDSYEYIAVDGFDWLTGVPNRFRLPLYPMLIDIAKALFGEHALSAVYLGQLLVSLGSSVAFFAAMERISSRRGLNLLVATLYSLAPAVMGWEKTLLTESLSLSLTVFLFWAVVSYLSDKKARYMLLAVVVLLLGCLLRAVFALYAALVFGFLLLRLLFPGEGSKGERRALRIHEAKLLPIAAIPIVLLIVYGSMFYARYGAFTLSDSGLGQQLSIVLQEDYFDGAQDEELKAVAQELLTRKTQTQVKSEIRTGLAEVFSEEAAQLEQLARAQEAVLEEYSPIGFLDQSYEEELTAYYQELYGRDYTASSYPELYRARCYIMNNYDRDRINTFVSQSIGAHRMQYLRFLLSATAEPFSTRIKMPKSGLKAAFSEFVFKSALVCYFPTLGQALLVGFAELGIFLYLLLRKKRLSWLHLGLAGFLLSTGLLAVFGTNADFARTAQTMLPFVFAAVGCWLLAGADRIAGNRKRLQMNAL